MGSKVRITIFSLGFVACLAVFLYPTFSNIWNQYQTAGFLRDYSAKIAEGSREDYDLLWAQAEEYNSLLGDEEALAEAGYSYPDMLNPHDDGIMGYIEIPKIRVELPIYHTLEESVLQSGVGHMEDTALPVGTEGMRSVLAGHTGLANARLLSDLNQMKIGDVFYLHILNRDEIYQVVSTVVVLPEETRYLRNLPGEKLVTLVTCTPFGINSHRLLITGRRIEPGEVITETGLLIYGEDGEIINPFYVLPVQMILLGLFAGTGYAVRVVMKKRGGRHGKE